MFNKKSYLVAMMLVVLCASAQAKETDSGFTFICHKGLNYTHTEIMYAFKGFLDEPRPIDNQSLFPQMLKEINYTKERYKKNWDKNFFRRALFIPRMVNSDADVIRWVAASYAGIGYVHEAPRNNPNVEACGNR